MVVKKSGPMARSANAAAAARRCQTTGPLSWLTRMIAKASREPAETRCTHMDTVRDPLLHTVRDPLAKAMLLLVSRMSFHFRVNSA